MLCGIQQCQILFQLVDEVDLWDLRGARGTRDMFHISDQSINQKWKRRHSTQPIPESRSSSCLRQHQQPWAQHWGATPSSCKDPCSWACQCAKVQHSTETWKLSVITQPFLQRSSGVMVFQAKQKAYCLLCPTWSSAVRLKGKGFEEGFSEKWISRKNVGDQPATSGKRGWA